MNKIIALVFISISLTIYAKAAKIDSVDVWSASMNKKIRTGIVLPNGYDKNKKYAVVYLLHGYSGNYQNWTMAKETAEGVDRYNFIAVCPDGGFGSWYWDSPVDASFKYETFVSKELVSWVDKTYATIASPKSRGITGLSMGGHGAMYLAIKHADVFGACGSMSGGVDIRPFPNNWDMAKRLGRYAQYPDRWEQNTVINMLHLIEPDKLKIIIDCGTEDFFYKVNVALHEQMLLRNIKHDFISRPGAHNWPYWANAVQYQLLFMNNFFEEAAQKK